MVRIDSGREYKIGDTVWWFDQYGDLRCGTVFEIGTEQRHKRQGKYVRVYLEGHKGSIMGAWMDECWPSRSECMRAETRRQIAQKKEYADSIRSVEDLVRFMFCHDLESEYKDYDAEAAVVQRAKDLLGIDLEK